VPFYTKAASFQPHGKSAPFCNHDGRPYSLASDPSRFPIGIIVYNESAIATKAWTLWQRSSQFLCKDDLGDLAPWFACVLHVAGESTSHAPSPSPPHMHTLARTLSRIQILYSSSLLKPFLATLVRPPYRSLENLHLYSSSLLLFPSHCTPLSPATVRFLKITTNLVGRRSNEQRQLETSTSPLASRCLGCCKSQDCHRFDFLSD
jgi:hypothetical protein